MKAHQQFMRNGFTALTSEEQYRYLERIGMMAGAANITEIPDSIHTEAILDVEDYRAESQQQ
jgi:hypothetical protein